MAGSKTELEFPDILEILAKTPSPAEGKQQVLAAFKAYDILGKGTIPLCKTRGERYPTKRLPL